MISDKKNVLLVAFHSFAGMGPYVISIVNSFNENDPVRFFLIEREDRYYSKNIKEELKQKATIIQTNSSSKFRTLISVIFGFRCGYAKKIEELCKKEAILMIHDLTGCLDHRFVRKMSLSYTWLYTVHDLFPHEANKSFFKELRQSRAYAGTFKSISESNQLITNSRYQFADLHKLYPKKKSYFVPFPTLITKTIQNGGKSVPELKGINSYILFFGRIEEYKGLSILVEAFKTVNTDVKLVVAGTGSLPFDIDDSRIIFINRYIDDGEVEDLYTKSKFVVYPYISATQSGVLAVAAYFKTPVIASDLPFFVDVLGNDYPGIFKSRDSKDLARKIDCFLKQDSESTNQLKAQMENLYRIHYESQAQRERLIAVYDSIMGTNFHLDHE